MQGWCRCFLGTLAQTLLARDAWLPDQEVRARGGRGAGQHCLLEAAHRLTGCPCPFRKCARVVGKVLGSTTLVRQH